MHSQKKEDKIENDFIELDDGISLMLSGAASFREILFCIEHAVSSIHINMFLWREDEIGCKIGYALLEAAARGVNVFISIDRYAAPLEYAEENRLSLFHRECSLHERFHIGVLLKLYPDLHSNDRPQKSDGELYRLLTTDPRIRIENYKKKDHSKYYVFDNETIILGGVNIEDKENGHDIRGTIYRDYMIKLHGAKYITALDNALMGKGSDLPDIRFVINRREPPSKYLFAQHYLELIDQSNERLIIIMPYFAPLSAFMQAILRACRRGVRVRLMVPASANYQDDKNKYTMRYLLKHSGGKIEVYFSPLLIHTKLIISDDTASVGSCNLTRDSLYDTSELNIATSKAALTEALLADAEKNINDARQCFAPSDIHFNLLIALMEIIYI